MPKTKAPTKTPTRPKKSAAAFAITYNKEVRESGAIYAAALRDVAKKAKVDPAEILAEAPNAKVERALKKDNMQFVAGWFRALQDASGATPGEVLAWFPEGK